MLTADKQRSKALHTLRLVPLPVAAGEVIFVGALVCTDATGVAVPAADAAGTVFQGVAHRGFDNSAGADGDLSGPLSQQRYCEVDQNGPYSFAVDGAAPISGDTALVVDDDTVSAAATVNSLACGRFTEPDPAQAGNWFVDVERGV